MRGRASADGFKHNGVLPAQANLPFFQTRKVCVYLLKRPCPMRLARSVLSGERRRQADQGCYLLRLLCRESQIIDEPVKRL